jgi:uncharacterized protein YoxC
MNTQRIEVQPDNKEISLEQSAKDLGIANVNVGAEVISTNSGTQAVISQPKNLTESTEQKPEWLPEKFKSAEELAKAYSELEKKFSANVKSAKEQTKNNSEQVKLEENVLDRFNQEYADNGMLSDNSYQELAKLGLNKEIVDGYIEGQKALSDNYQKEVYQEVGSQDKYAELINWASENLSDEEVQSYNEIIESGSMAQMKLAVRGLMATAGMNKSNFQRQELFEGDSDVFSSDAFRSIAQVTQAMNDPRYEKDPAYRKEVTDRLAKSTIL